jgi:hypothetical protein
VIFPDSASGMTGETPTSAAGERESGTVWERRGDGPWAASLAGLVCFPAAHSDFPIFLFPFLFCFLCQFC